MTSLLNNGSMLTGGIHGLLDGLNVPIDPENLEASLTYGPAIVKGAICSILPGIGGAAGGGLGGGLALAGAGFVYGAATGGFFTLVGYFGGRIAGEVIDVFV
jgi:hypothetical protein